MCTGPVHISLLLRLGKDKRAPADKLFQRLVSNS